MKILGTGGTLSCTVTSNGLSPTLSIEEITQRVPEMARFKDIDYYQFRELDSTEILPQDILELSWRMSDQENTNRFVVTHGTDTMAYTAALLSYLLMYSDATVSITGSQRSIEEENNDVGRNLSDAALVSSSDIRKYTHPVSYIVFNRKIISGVRGRKRSSTSLDAFASINKKLYGYAEDNSIWLYDQKEEKRLPNIDSENLRFFTNISENAAFIKMNQGYGSELDLFRGLYTINHNIINLGYEGIIFEGFGMGGVPERIVNNIITQIREDKSSGVKFIGVVSECSEEPYVDLEKYSVGRKLLDAGVVGLYDMNVESALAKLQVVLGNESDEDKITRAMLTNHIGEISIPEYIERRSDYKPHYITPRERSTYQGTATGMGIQQIH